MQRQRVLLQPGGWRGVAMKIVRELEAAIREGVKHISWCWLPGEVPAIKYHRESILTAARTNPTPGAAQGRTDSAARRRLHNPESTEVTG